MVVSKTALTITSVAVALLFGGGVYLLMNMNIIAKSYIERSASETLGVKVSLGNLDINLKDRSARVTNLTIGNPEGFDENYAVKVGTVNVVLGNLTKQLVNMKDIDVDDTWVNLEVKENVTNLSAIRNRIKAAPPSDAKEALKVIIDKLALSQAQIKPVHVLYTEDELPTVRVPDIVLTGIGQKENGVLVNEAIAYVFDQIAHKLDTKALNSGLLKGVSDEALGEMGLGFTQRFKENLQETVKEKVDTLNQNIDRMFND